MTQQQETVFYQDPSPIFISSDRTIFFDKTILTRNIVSVSIQEVIPGRSGEIFVTLFGATFSLIIALALTSTKFNSNLQIAYFSLFMVSLGILVFGLFKFITKTPHHALEIATPASKEKIVVSPDLGYITTLQNSLNQALLFNSHNR